MLRQASKCSYLHPQHQRRVQLTCICCGLRVLPCNHAGPLRADRDAGDYLPSTSEPSSLLEDAHLCALAAAVPLRHRWRRWRLVYATARDGISLSTLYRHATFHALCLF